MVAIIRQLDPIIDPRILLSALLHQAAQSAALTRFLPPSTEITAPVMYAPAGLASMIHGPRISSLVPTLPSGVRFATTCTGGKSCRAFGSEAVGAGREVISVGNVPGRIVLTRMCSLGVSS